MRIGLIIGSLSAASINRRVGDALVEVLGDRVEVEELPLAHLPLYNRDLDTAFPEAASAFKRRLAAVDGLIFVTPEYNRSLPAALKNALEWGSRPAGENAFPGIPAGVLGVSSGRLGTALAQHQVREILAYLDMPTLGQPELYLTFDAAQFDGDSGRVTDPKMRERLEGWADRFLAHVVLHQRGLV